MSASRTLLRKNSFARMGRARRVKKGTKFARVRGTIRSGAFELYMHVTKGFRAIRVEAG